MEEKTITCIICPIGCEIKVRAENNKIKEIEDYKCERGKEYAKNEYLNPTRVLATTVKIENFRLPVTSVKTEEGIPKDLIFDCMAILKNTEIEGPVNIGETVVENILDTGIDVVTTKR